MNEKFLLVEVSEIRELLQQEFNKFFEILKTDLHGSTEEWIDSKDVPAYLKVSGKTWQVYRDQRLIPFSQVGRKIRVRKSDLNAFLEKCMVKSVEL